MKLMTLKSKTATPNRRVLSTLTIHKLHSKPEVGKQWLIETEEQGLIVTTEVQRVEHMDEGVTVFKTENTIYLLLGN